MLIDKYSNTVSTKYQSIMKNFFVQYFLPPTQSIVHDSNITRLSLLLSKKKCNLIHEYLVKLPKKSPKNAKSQVSFFPARIRICLEVEVSYLYRKIKRKYVPICTFPYPRKYMFVPILNICQFIVNLLLLLFA